MTDALGEALAPPTLASVAPMKVMPRRTVEMDADRSPGACSPPVARAAFAEDRAQ